LRPNSSKDSILKIHITKRAVRVAQGEGPEFTPQYCKKKNSSRPAAMAKRDIQKGWGHGSSGKAPA
jgi:hypothetical protein